MFKKLELKDYILMGLISAVYTVMTQEQINDNLTTYAGIAGVGMLTLAIIGACIGIFIGRKILLKHFKKGV